MKSILITAATDRELDSVKDLCGDLSQLAQNIRWEVTGIGGVETSYHLSQLLTNCHFDLVVNVGIAGSFVEAYPIGAVVVVECDRFADLGVGSSNGFTHLFDIGLADPNKAPYQQGQLKSPLADTFSKKLALPMVRGISVNACSGDTQTIEQRLLHNQPHIETMETAAFFYTCIMKNVDFVALRAISNRVEVRNTSNWDIPLALRQLGIVTKALLFAIRN